MRPLRPAAALLLLLSTGVAAGQGVHVVAPDPAHALAAAGLRAGDRLIAWEVMLPAGEIRRGEFDDVFDVFRVSTSLAPLGKPMLRIERGGESLALQVPPGYWVAELAPAVPGHSRFEEAVEALGDPRTATTGRTALERLLRETRDALDTAWYRHILAEALRRDGDTAVADAQTEQAVNAALAVGETFAAGWLLQKAGIQYFGLGQAARGMELLRRALGVWESGDPDSLAVAHCLNNLAIAASIRSDYETSERYGTRALEIRRRLLGDSLLTADVLHTLGNTAFWSDDLATAEGHYREALSIRRAREPGGIAEARTLAVLGNVYWRYGQLGEARSRVERALAIYRARGADPVYVGESLVSLGHFAHDQGDYAAAERYRLQALQILEDASPQATQIPDTLLGLGNVSWRRGDYTAAEAYFERALTRYEAIQPRGQRVSGVLMQLGQLALERGRVAAASDYLAESMAILQKLGAAGPLLASRHQALAGVARARGRYETAGDHLRQALALYTEKTDENLQAAEVYRDQAAIHAAQGRNGAAIRRLEQALDIAEALAPGTLHEALPAYDLAVLLESGDDLKGALAAYERAAGALDGQRSLLGGSQRARASFEQRYGHIYKDYLRLLLETGRDAAAFDLLERYRARALLALTAERRLDLGHRLPGDLAERLERANWHYEQAQLLLAESTAPSAEDVREIARLRSEREELVARAREQYPAEAAAVPPRPLSLAEAAAALPPDTALVSYALLEGETALFFLPAGGKAADLAVYRLPVGRAKLGDAVRRLRLLLKSPDAGAATRTALDELSSSLFDRLLAPAAERIGTAGRLLIVPDGALHLLPFGLLRDADGIYLVERLPLQTALSVTVYGLMREPQSRPAPLAIAAIGSASPGAEASSAPRARQPGFTLPAARRELAMIGDVFGDAVIHSGAAASEARLFRTAPESRILHLATHAVADPRRPLDSYLLLSPDRERTDGSGIVHAWEIYERLSLAADLVVLSACDTGVGTVMGGDGLVSLTRAFQYAGARSVLASLWPVSDAATAELMRGFYEGLHDGMTTDEALRNAQLALAKPHGWQRLRHLFAGRGADWSHPYYWAGFQLHGPGDRALTDAR